MENVYRVISNKNNRDQLRAQLRRDELLSVGIMDTGTKEELESSIYWYRKYFNYNIHVVTVEDKFSTEVMKKDFPDVTFILFKEAPALAQRVNSIANTCLSTYFIVVRSDTDLVDIDFKALETTMNSPVKPVCITPLIFNKDKVLVPTVRVPKFKGNNIDPHSLIPSKKTDRNLYPFLGVGLYDRSVFHKLKGFDEILEGAYWQAMDFGTRAWLYGYSVLSSNSVSFIFPDKQFLLEDRTETANVDRFYTKALCAKLVRGKIRIRKGYRTDKHVLRTEVKPRAELYKTDFEALTESWVNPEY